MNDFESLLERFSIMTTDGKLSDNEAMDYCRKNTTPELYAELEKYYRPQQTRHKNKESDFETLAKYIKEGFEI